MTIKKLARKVALDDLAYDVGPAGTAQQTVLTPVDVEVVYSAIEYIVIVALA